MNEIIYFRYGQKYKKVMNNGVIKPGAMNCWCQGELSPIPSDEEIIGKTPSNFSDEREFFNPIKEALDG